MKASDSRDLNRALTFVRVVESGSFSGAASALELPTSSVSRAVAKLEDSMGVQLLQRTTRRFSLTDAGRSYYERARDAVVALDEASKLAIDAAAEPRGIVRVAAPLEMSRPMAAIATEFTARWPKIQVDVTFASRGEELVGAAVDVALVTGRLADSSLIALKLGSTVFRLYAAPSYLDRRGVPRRLAELSRHDAVLYRGEGGSVTWELSHNRRKESVVVRGRVSSDQQSFVLEAATEGLGVALLPEFFAEPAAREGRLRNVLTRYYSEGALRSLVLPARHQPTRVTLLRDFLTERLSTPSCHSNLAPSTPG